MRAAQIGAIASSMRIASAKVALINLTQTGQTTTDPGYSNFLISLYNTPVILNTTGWTIVANGVAGQSPATVTGTYGDPVFPDDVLHQAWQNNPGGTQVFTVAGLNTTKTYTVVSALASSAGQAGDGKVTVTVGGSSQIGTLTTGPLLVKLTFTGVVSDGSGNLSISYGGANVFPILNAISITEN